MARRVRWSALRRLAVSAVFLVGAGFYSTVQGQGPPLGADEDRDDGSFGLSAPVACKEIGGYEDYIPLPAAGLTCDEKLHVYYLPRHFKSARKGKKFEAHFTQEGRIRRRGQKAVVWSKSFDYRVASDAPPRRVYLTNVLALKALKPGEYEYDIVLRDAVANSPAAVKTLSFTVLPSPQTGPSASKDEGPARP